MVVTDALIPSVSVEAAIASRAPSTAVTPPSMSASRSVMELTSMPPSSGRMRSSMLSSSSSNHGRVVGLVPTCHAGSAVSVQATPVTDTVSPTSRYGRPAISTPYTTVAPSRAAVCQSRRSTVTPAPPCKE